MKLEILIPPEALFATFNARRRNVDPYERSGVGLEKLGPSAMSRRDLKDSASQKRKDSRQEAPFPLRARRTPIARPLVAPFRPTILYAPRFSVCISRRHLLIPLLCGVGLLEFERSPCGPPWLLPGQARLERSASGNRVPANIVKVPGRCLRWPGA